MADQISVIRAIDAPAEKVWAMVADSTRMGEWSPENEGSMWLRGATGPKPGARFSGANRNGKKKWKAAGTIIDTEPGRLLSFRITAAGFKVAEWHFRFETTATRCRVTEMWIDQRGHIAEALGKPVSGVADRAGHNRATMEKTLERLRGQRSQQVRNSRERASEISDHERGWRAAKWRDCALLPLPLVSMSMTTLVLRGRMREKRREPLGYRHVLM